MVPIRRGPAPRVLTEKTAAWTGRYLAERQSHPSRRPDHRCYGHDEVRVELRRMSHHKCFYCERKLTETEGEVDHYVEAAERPQDAFTWGNLYLACPDCNRRKVPNTTLSVVDCVDPCAADVAPDAHVTFDDECIEPREGSERGRNTIRKYLLDRQDLDLARLRALKGLYKTVVEFRERMSAEGRRDFSAAERQILQAYGDPIRPFSLMMKTYLDRMGL